MYIYIYIYIPINVDTHMPPSSTRSSPLLFRWRPSVRLNVRLRRIDYLATVPGLREGEGVRVHTP